jgi:hypothetical protein
VGGAACFTAALLLLTAAYCCFTAALLVFYFIRGCAGGTVPQASLRKYVSSYYYVSSNFAEGTVSSYYCICVLIILYMRPHTTIYVSSYYCICVLILLYMCPHTTMCVSFVLMLLCMCPYTTICVLILLCMCPHTTMCPHTLMYVSSYQYIRVLLPDSTSWKKCVHV